MALRVSGDLQIFSRCQAAQVAEMPENESALDLHPTTTPQIDDSPGSTIGT